jgi:ATP-dependent Clp protease ATP-binding subunit ClpA
MRSRPYAFPLLIALLVPSGARVATAAEQAATSAVPAPAVPAPEKGMKRFIIIRNFPDGAVEGVDNAAAKKQINTINAAHHVKWVHSFVNAEKNKTFCIYDGPSAQAIRDAAKANNMPADEVVEIPNLVRSH